MECMRAQLRYRAGIPVIANAYNGPQDWPGNSMIPFATSFWKDDDLECQDCWNENGYLQLTFLLRLYLRQLHKFVDKSIRLR